LTALRGTLKIFAWRNTFRYTQKPRRISLPVKIGSQAHRSSAISTSNETTILVRGRDLTKELIGRINFTEHFWLLLTGDLPSPAQRTILDATLVAIAEHGMVPSVQASRLTLAASPEALQGAVAAGILGCGSVVLGSSEAAGQFFAQVAERAGNQAAGIDEAAMSVLKEYLAGRRAIPGYGHPLHKDYDPRALRLFEISEEALGAAGIHVQIARALAAQRHRQAAGDQCLRRDSGCAPRCGLSAARPERSAVAGPHGGVDRPFARGAAAANRIRHFARGCGGDRLRRRAARGISGIA
jgi:hypothetical protein